MGEQLPKIKTPWKQQWKRVRYQLLPVLTMGLCVLAVGWLWSHHAGLMNGTGAVNIVRRDAVAHRDGVLVALPRQTWRLYDEVREGHTVLARLDDQPAMSALSVLKNEITRLQVDLPAKEELIKLDQQNRGLSSAEAEEARRLAAQVEARRLQALDYKVALAADRIELQRLDMQLDGLDEEFLTGEARQQLLAAEARRDVLLESVRANERAVADAQAQLDAALSRIKARPTLALANAQKVLASLQAEVAALEAQMRDVEQQVDSLQILAPISGQIVAVHRWPGQTIRAGEPVCTIADVSGRHIISYVRQDQRLRPMKGMKVQVRARLPGSLAYDCLVEDVGPSVELVPEHQLRDPRMAEWGVPVRIPLPAGLDLRPGELVDLRFRAVDGG